MRSPDDLAGKSVGVTGLPSDDAVLDSVLRAGGVAPGSVRRVTIGFQAVSSLAAGKVAAATAFWNAEGVTLRRRGIPIRVFRVDRYGAPRYPELVLCTTGRLISAEPSLVRSVVDATARGYSFAVDHPGPALASLTDSVPDLDAVPGIVSVDCAARHWSRGSDAGSHRWILRSIPHRHDDVFWRGQVMRDLH